MASQPQFQIPDIQALVRCDWRGLLVGLYRCRLDRSGRLVVPLAFRDVFEANGFTEVAAYSDGNCVRVFPAERYAPVIRDRTFVGVVPGGVAAITLLHWDKRGRLVVPKTFRQGLALRSEVLCLGHGRSIQLWDEATYFVQRRPPEPVAVDRIPIGRAGFLAS